MPDSRPAPGSRPRWLFPLLALLVGFLGALALGEVLVRVLDPPGSELPREVPPGPWQPGMEPGSSGVTRFHESGTWHAVPYQVNQAGFRDREHTREKPPGTLRVAILGDSFVAGLAVPQETLFPRVLEELLARGGGKGAREVLAFGSVGYGTGLELLTLERRALAFSPDVVVLSFFQNDPWDNHPGLGDQRVPYFRQDESGALELLPEPRGKPSRRRGALNWLKRSSRLYVFQKLLVRRITEGWKYRSRKGIDAVPKVYHPLVDPPIPLLDEAWALTLALVDRIDSLCRASGARLVVMDIPLQEEVSPFRREATTKRFPGLAALEIQWDRSRVRLGGHCRERGIPYLDLREPLGREGDPAAAYLPEDGHLTVEGHRRVARALAGFLTQEGLLSGAAPASPGK